MSTTSEKLISLGVYPNLKGFCYILTAVNNYSPGDGIMTVYKKVAKEYRVSAINVERCIRAVKERTKYKRLTNAEFIALLQWEKEDEKCQGSRENESVESEEVTLGDTKKTTQESTQVLSEI